MAEQRKITLQVNGKTHTLEADPDAWLLWALRDELGLTGTKYGCGEGQCGACAVLLDGIASRACRVKLSRAEGREITTIEGLATNGNLTPLQQSFIDNGAFSCGFCTPGMIIVATALLARNPQPTRQQIVEAMDSNLCRCGGYLNIIEAIEAAAGTGGQS